MKSTEFVFGHFYSFGNYTHFYFCTGPNKGILICQNGDVLGERIVGNAVPWYEVFPEPHQLVKFEEWKAQNL